MKNRGREDGDMRLLINAVEMFDLKGSGIKYFSRSLFRAAQEISPGSNSLLLQISGRRSESFLADSTIFQVHEEHPNQPSLLLRKGKLLLREKARASFRVGAPRVRIRAIGTSDPMLPTALRRLPSSGGEDGGEAEEPKQHPMASARDTPYFHGGVDLFRLAKERYVISRRPTRMRLEDLSAKARKAMIFHNPLPFPLLAEGMLNVTTIHDVIPLTHPELCLDNPAEVFSLLSQTIDHCDGIHSISHYTAETLLSIFGERLRPKLWVIQQPTPLPSDQPGTAGDRCSAEVSPPSTASMQREMAICSSWVRLSRRRTTKPASKCSGSSGKSTPVCASW